MGVCQGGVCQGGCLPKEGVPCDLFHHADLFAVLTPTECQHQCSCLYGDGSSCDPRCDLNSSVRGRVSSSRKRLWTLPNLYSEVSALSDSQDYSSSEPV